MKYQFKIKCHPHGLGEIFYRRIYWLGFRWWWRTAGSVYTFTMAGTLIECKDPYLTDFDSAVQLAKSWKSDPNLFLKFRKERDEVYRRMFLLGWVRHKNKDVII